MLKYKNLPYQNGKPTSIDNVPCEFIKYGGSKLQSAVLDIKRTEKILDECYRAIERPIH